MMMGGTASQDGNLAQLGKMWQKLKNSFEHQNNKSPFPLQAWKEAFFVCFIDFFTSFRAQELNEAKNQ